MILGIYGLGNFGFAVANHLDKKYLGSEDIAIRGYEYDSTIRAHLQKYRMHPSQNGAVKLSKYFEIHDSPEALLKDCDIVVLAVSSNATRSIIKQLQAHLKPGAILVNTAKALDYETGERLSEVYKEHLTVPYSYSAFSGGTIAKDLIAHEPLGIDLASKDSRSLNTLKEVFSSNELFVNTTNDIIGVELAGALKNIISVFAGLTKGSGFSYGSETHIISVIAHKMGTVCVDIYGANKNTFSIGSQSWGNDMWMSATGKTRNKEYGELLGKGLSPSEAIRKMDSMNKTVEAINTLRIIDTTQFAELVPEIRALCDYIVHNKIDLSELRKNLLTTR